MKDWDKAYREQGEVQTWVSSIVKKHLGMLKERGAKKVLDLCFGTGRNAIFLAEEGFDVYGIDISPKGKEIAEKKANAKGLTVHLEVSDMHNLPYEDDFFDAIFAVYALEHNNLAGLKKTISELERVLKPKGLIIATLISTKDPRYTMGREVEPNTRIDLGDPTESDVPHRFSDEAEARNLFSKFNVIEIKDDTGVSKRRGMPSVHWEITAEKP